MKQRKIGTKRANLPENMECLSSLLLIFTSGDRISKNKCWISCVYVYIYIHTCMYILCIYIYQQAKTIVFIVAHSNEIKMLLGKSGTQNSTVSRWSHVQLGFQFPPLTTSRMSQNVGPKTLETSSCFFRSQGSGSPATPTVGQHCWEKWLFQVCFKN